MKKLIAFISLAAVMALLTACGGAKADVETTEQTKEEAVLSSETQITQSDSEMSVASEVISEISETKLLEDTTSVSETLVNEPQIRVEWADEAVLTADHDECDIFEPSEEQAKVSFTSDTPVKDFVILELTLTDCSDEGVMTFDAYPAASPDITPEKPLVIGFTFMGDIPGYGFQYEDADGNIRRFAMEISGEDGSLITREASGEYYDFVLE